MPDFISNLLKMLLETVVGPESGIVGFSSFSLSFFSHFLSLFSVHSSSPPPSAKPLEDSPITEHNRRKKELEEKEEKR